MARPITVIVGVGPGNGAALARRFARDGHEVVLLSRGTSFTAPLAAELGGRALAVDASDAMALGASLGELAQRDGAPAALVYNAGNAAWGSLDDIEVDQVAAAFRLNALGLYAAAKAVVPAMRAAGSGTILITGATASLRGKPKTMAFAAAKAAQRSLAQSLARELWPQNIHVALVILDGVIAIPGRPVSEVHLSPEAIADAYFTAHRQPPDAWSFEIELRPSREPW
jgi:short-subunit dehydrogenase